MNALRNGIFRMNTKTNLVALTLVSVLIPTGFAATTSVALAQAVKPETISSAFALSSPDKRIVVKVEVKNRLSYSVQFRGKPLLVESAFALEFKNAPPIFAGLRVKKTQTTERDSHWENRFGKRRNVRDNYRELTLDLEETQAPKRRFELIFRAYDDAVAIRYFLPDQPNLHEFTLTKEALEFRFPNDPVVWAANYGGYSSAQESEFIRQKMSQLSPDAPYGTPLLAQVASNAYAAISEADLQDWAGLYLSGVSEAEKTPLYQSRTMNGGDIAEKIDVSIKGKRRLRLVVNNGGNDYINDHADWGDAVLIDKDGKRTPLGSLKPSFAKQEFGTLAINKSVQGNPLKIRNESFAVGLGMHSIGECGFDLDKDYERFQCSVGIDAEVGDSGSAGFEIYASDGRSSTRSGLITRLAPRRDGNGLVVSGERRSSPWRVVLIGDRPGKLVESDTILNLNPPCALKASAWIVPGKCAWDNWWSGEVKMDTATNEEFISFASEMGFPYQLIDSQWYGAFNTPDANIVKPNPAIDLPEIIRFAKSKRVREIVWLHSNDVDKRLKEGSLDQAFALYEKWGLAGVKIDFMNRDDQEMVQWYRKVVLLAASHRLLVDFHGAYKSTGMERTYPNQITREGVMGEEWDKFSNRVTPEHDCTIPFTRMLAGPMDYTPGGFLNRGRADWKQTLPTQTQGTRCHELAKFVIFDSPLTVLCDHPRNYRGQAGLEFLKEVPTVWEETKVVAGSVGEYAVSVRKSGKRWFLGGMTNWSQRKIDVPLSFLGKGTFRAHLYSDSPDENKNASNLVEIVKTARSSDVLSLNMASGGGVAIIFTPL